MMASISEIDRTTYLWFNQFQQQKWLMKITRGVSFTGDGYFYPLIAGFIYLINKELGLIFLFTGLLAFLFEIPSFIGLKHLFKRNRPFVQLHNAKKLVQPSDKFSLPSGHAAAAFVVATLIAYMFPYWAGLAYLWATLIGLSRVLLGVHYPGDIIAGAALGVMCTFVSILALA
ncbi:Putative undecaprenyl-diphosphatase YbjG [BD1-7 clade bacterium]|uniref:undecaprenyl-diphosphate phosphatase n=1 Tax=BD1-7 clade bacterium TaxID=2029982 RepID=A0A5S9PTD6_9GAMM|nr:Putative undecaprenyl-diphosphatase YbjG [BD1-7 clade bacterium]CAA0094862.1 Putative undecaprenyl-diphosphatase YbjG [BD1-7 clade bacterium]CAA0107978.1 Putative undecaprenyl-diphosphatase YbjG [BD1-7 clade bacterium]